MALKTAASIEDLAALARKRLPSFVFDYLDGGSGADQGVAHGRAALERLRLRSVPLAGIARVDTETELFGRKYAMPLGVAPMGMANLVWPDTDLILARLAQRERIPYVLSTVASTSIEDTVRAAPDMTWFQLYAPRTEESRRSLLSRCANAGIEVLVLTLDVQADARRNRNIRNNFSIRFRVTPGIALNLMARPHWALATLAAGVPRPGNYVNAEITGPADNSAKTLIERAMRDSKGDLTWDDFRRIRDDWKGKLVVKGLLDPEAARALALGGADAIWVSTHGGRQLEHAVAAIDALPLIRKAVGPDTKLLFDSSIRSGADIVKACALGADMVFGGRCFAYGTGAGGAEGADKALEILREEVRTTLILMGRDSLCTLDSGWVITP